MKYAKKVLLVSDGGKISQNIVLYLAKCGCKVVLMGDESVQRILDVGEGALMSAVPSLETVHVNMEDDNEEAFDGAVEKAWNLLGGLDAFVYCLAYEGHMRDPLQITENEMKKILQLNFLVPWFLLKAVGRRMRDRKMGGSIVLLSSIAGAERGVYPGATMYGSSSAGIQQLVKHTAMEMGKHKIRVNAVARGLHLHDEFLTHIGIKRASKLVESVVPLKRWLDVKNDLASTILYLISDDSRYMTGTTIIVDGGQSLARPRMRAYM